jgi:hypothetical protein
MQVFTHDDLKYFYNQPEVLEAKQKSGTVSFQVDSNDSIRKTLQTYGINAGDKVPMRWIEGDTEDHSDTGREKFEKTFLAYLEGSGNFIFGNETHTIGENTGFIFNEGVKHRTEGASKRLVVGPMNEMGNPVGATQNISQYVGTFTVASLFNSITEPIHSLSVYACSISVFQLNPDPPVFGVLALPSGVTPTMVCSFTGLDSFTEYAVTEYLFSVTGETLVETTFNSVRTLPCFAGVPTVPENLYSLSSISSWTSDVSLVQGRADATYGFKRYVEGIFVDETELLSVSNSISNGYNDLFQFSITAFVSNSCGYTESLAYGYDNCYDVGGSFSSFTYFGLTNLGFSYTINIAGITGANVVYSYSENIGSQPLKVGDSLTGFVLFDNVADEASIMAINCGTNPVYSSIITGPNLQKENSAAFVALVVTVGVLFAIFTLVFAYNAYMGRL